MASEGSGLVPNKARSQLGRAKRGQRSQKKAIKKPKKAKDKQERAKRKPKRGNRRPKEASGTFASLLGAGWVLAGPGTDSVLAGPGGLLGSFSKADKKQAKGKESKKRTAVNPKHA